MPPPTPLRLLIVLPSWVGDATMATPALARIRACLPGCFIGALARPGIDELLAGTEFFDEVHTGRASGVMGHKHLASRLRPRRYDTALLLTNSFSTALTTRLAGIPRRIGFDRDARGLLLTDRLAPPKSNVLAFALISATDYYWLLADHLLAGGTASTRPAPGSDAARFAPLPPIASVLERTLRGELSLPAGNPLSLAATAQDHAHADAILARAALGAGERFALLNPGGNNPAKRWPAERFAQLADYLADQHHLGIALNGSPGEMDLCRAIASACTVARPALLPELGITLGALKAITQRAALMVTNDTGPRHIAAAMGVPLVSLFGPTDHRWTLIPTRPGAPEVILPADPTLPPTEQANDHPERCAITRISVERVREACDGVLGARREREGGRG